jgi:hypothetical protein
MADRRQMGYVSSTVSTSITIQAPIVYGVATGGTSSTISVGGVSYTMLRFTSSSTLTVTTAGFFDFTIVGGGEAGYYSGGTQGGGGGGGGALVLAQQMYLEAGTYPVGVGGSGSISYVNGYASGKPLGPGRGGHLQGAGVAAIVGGFSGGSGVGAGPNSNANGGGGGGGMGAVGLPPKTNKGYGNMTDGGDGGAGVDWSAWRGESAGTTRYGAGGGGGGGYAGGGGVGGAGGGGTGNTYYQAIGTAGTANTGSGGGGYSEGAAPLNGGSGIVLVRFKV